LEGAKPLAERYESARALAMREIPLDDPERAVVNSMVSEASIDLIYDAVGRAMKRKEPPPPDPATREAARELYQFQMDFNSAALEIKAAQPWLHRTRSDWRHRLMGSLSANICQVPGWFSP